MPVNCWCGQVATAALRAIAGLMLNKRGDDNDQFEHVIYLDDAARGCFIGRVVNRRLF